VHNNNVPKVNEQILKRKPKRPSGNPMRAYRNSVHDLDVNGSRSTLTAGDYTSGTMT
jgi:hypothetical protein